ncbi:MAG: trigger factor [Candidatus Eisenbacteria bacterium]|nr:trigger factor [Candidatus Eisenbacteria bacterium]
MKVELKELDNWMRELRIGIPEAAVEERYKERMAQYRKDFEAKGFRKGKAPMSMVEGKFGQLARAEAIESLMPEAIAEAVREKELRPVCDPVIESLETSPVDGHYHFTTTIGVRPEIELKEYEGLELTERVPTVSNEDVDRAIEELRERNADLEPVTRPAVPGDYVIIDYERLDDEGKPVPDSRVEGQAYELGAGQIPPELEEALKGMSPAGETTVAVTFPEQSSVKELAGGTVSFAVTVRDVREKRLPAVDDEFAKKAAGAETVLDLRVKVRNSLEKQAKDFARRRLEDDLVKELIEKNPFELPECLVRDRLDLMLERFQSRQPEGASEIDRTQFEEVYKPVVVRQLRAGLLLGAIAEKHDIDVDESDVRERVTEVAESQGKDPGQFMKDLEGSDLIDQLKDDLWLSKVHEFALGLSRITTEEYEPPQEEGESAGEGA